MGIPRLNVRGQKLLALALLATSLPGAALASPQNGPQATFQAPTVSAPVKLTNADGNQSYPSAGGNYLVYANCPRGNFPCNISGIDLTTRQGFSISQSLYSQTLPSTDGKTAVWMDARPTKLNNIGDRFNDYDRDFDIYAANLSDKKEFLVAQAPKLQTRPRVSGDYIVWADFRDAKSADDPLAGEIYMYQISTGKTTQVTKDPQHLQDYPDTNGKTVVWADFRNEPDPQGFNSDIYGYDIASGQEFQIASAHDQQFETKISGNIVVWTDYRNDTGDGTNGDIYGYNLDTKQEFPIHVGPGRQSKPQISGNLVVWQAYLEDRSIDIYAYDLTSKQEFPIVTDPGSQENAGVTGNTVTWSYSASGSPGQNIDRRIYMATVGNLAPTTSGPLDPPNSLPGAGTRLFPETQKTLTGMFLDYWTGNGGLAQQGFPISEVIGEKSDLNGQVYTVQYFERAVFEYHPEVSDPKYKVLLSQLGTFQYKRKYGAQGAPGQIPDNSAGSRLFTETGKRIGGRFLEYWTQNGGLAQQGLPLSDPFMEKSDTNGQTYMVQYFERAVFELHPENPKPNDVLLSLLGVFQYKQKYQGGSNGSGGSGGGNPQPTAQPQPTTVADPCAGIPAGQRATVSPTCGKAGTVFVITGTGFTPGEKVGRYYTGPAGQVVSGTSQSTADSSGAVTFRFSSDGATGSEIGIWAGTFEGVDSHSKAIAYFKVLAP